MPFNGFEICSLAMSAWVFLTNFITFLGVIRKYLLHDRQFNPLEASDRAILSLVVADAGFALSNLVPLVAANGELGVPQHRSICLASAIACPAFGSASIMSVIALGYVRWKVVTRCDSDYKYPPAQVTTILAAGWIASFLSGLLSLIPNITDMKPSGLICHGESRPVNDFVTFYAIVQLCLCIVPNAALLIVYARIYRQIQAFPKEVLRANEGHRLTILMVCISVSSFISSWPYIGGQVYQLSMDRHLTQASDAVIYLILYSNFMLNPPLYAHFQRKYRDAIFDLFCTSRSRQNHGTSVSTKLTLVSRPIDFPERKDHTHVLELYAIDESQKRGTSARILSAELESEHELHENGKVAPQML